ncbi:MAG: class I SAM-dependent methyltransferase [Bacilli bacterium]|nr:class I SAM-dependent methyltransferase [Bacilli bacterium]
MNREEVLNNFYNDSCNEDMRLNSQHAQVEFLTTVKYIGEYLKPNCRILEIGAGTGAYSLYYANKGYDVTAIEYVEHNVDILKSKITDQMNIVAEQGDALDLSRFEDNIFDITLVLGPLYHLFDDNDINKAIDEAIRVTKQNGIIAIAYLTNDSTMINWGLMGNHLIDGYPKYFDDNFRIVRFPEGIFSHFYISEFKKLMNNYDIELLHNVATDGFSCYVKEKLDSLTKEEFDVWMKYHLSTCEREDLQGYSNHMLYICRKR